MKSIFESGFLKSEFINPNYRGLVGWDCSIDGMKGKLIALTEMRASFFMTGESNYCNKPFTVSIKIKQFSQENIPFGELCWFGIDIEITDSKTSLKIIERSWELYVSDETCNNPSNYEYCVPYLISETAKDAERLKDWDS